jgi:hypothetical protein
MNVYSISMVKYCQNSLLLQTDEKSSVMRALSDTERAGGNVCFSVYFNSPVKVVR